MVDFDKKLGDIITDYFLEEYGKDIDYEADTTRDRCQIHSDDFEAAAEWIIADISKAIIRRLWDMADSVSLLKSGE